MNSEQELLYALALQKTAKVGDILAKKLIRHCGSATAVLKEKKENLLKIDGIGTYVLSDIQNVTNIKDSEKELLFIQKENIKVHYFLDETYPNRLQHCADSPILLFQKGNANLNESTLPLESLSTRLQEEGKDATVLFLGDNIYQHGLPEKSNVGYELASHRLQTQIDAVRKFKGNRIFIPGNHDYHADGIKGLKRQENLVEKALGKNSFLPENGCPITKVKISAEVVSKRGVQTPN